MTNDTATENVETPQEAVETPEVETVAEEASTAPNEADMARAEESTTDPTAEAAAAEAAPDETPEAEAEAAAETEADTEADTEAAPAPQSIADLTPRLKLTGRVLSVKLYGALIDIGVERPGLLHISQLSNKQTQNPQDVLKEGAEVTVYVLNVDTDKGRINLSLSEPPALTWSEMRVNDVVQGTVVRIEDFGAFIDIGAERPGLIHVSELDNDYVNAVEDKVSLGDEVEARIINVDRAKKQVDLSIRALSAPEAVYEAEEDDSEPLTAMAIALQQALEGSEGDDASAAQGSQKRKRRRSSDVQEEIIARTLRDAR